MVNPPRAAFANIDPRIDYFEKAAETQNFGDYLPELFAKELLRYPKIEADVFRLVGSVISEKWIRWDLARANGKVSGLIALWLCGARNETPLSDATRKHCLFFGVRGPRTRDLLKLPADTVLGDPGLLAPLFHKPAQHAATAGKAICIPHIEDPKNEAELLALSGAEAIVYPVVDSSEAGLREILDKIAGAEFVLSGSLHGAIIACAYGVPFAFWNTGHVDAPFKWDDFAQSVGIEARFAVNLTEGREIWNEHISVNSRPPSLAAMLDVCPFVVRPAKLIQALALDGTIDREEAHRVALALDRLDDSSLDTARALIRRSAIHRDARESIVAVGSRRLRISLRRLARRASPKFVRETFRAIRLRGS